MIAFILAKLKYFAKQIIYLESPDHALQMMYDTFILYEFEFFRTSKNGLNSTTSRKLFIKSQKNFQIFKMIRNPINYLSDDL